MGSAGERWHDPLRMSPDGSAEGLPACLPSPASQPSACDGEAQVFFFPKTPAGRERKDGPSMPTHPLVSLFKLLSSYLNLSCKTLN